MMRFYVFLLVVFVVTCSITISLNRNTDASRKVNAVTNGWSSAIGDSIYNRGEHE